MALFGQLGEFVEGQEEWQQYTTYGTFPRCKWSDHRRAQTFYLSVGRWTQNLQVALQLGVTKQARRQVHCRTGTSTEKSLQPRAVRDRRALQISHSIQKTRGVCSDVCLRATDSSTDMHLWRFLGRYVQRPTGLWDKMTTLFSAVYYLNRDSTSRKPWSLHWDWKQR